ncbi:Spy/CpxP family protein refolding chaperone [Aliikangiella sp. G2MR2-5]|uniref:Spy/CpxP family protein refolding chaperone n=1 Tax=Aliikangiella sp. G2MR2-5 TaxID=2788943 RepID=UPI0018AAC395|nr:Spy/CpxP family protein refolding chaperone [Aliikangiella sp. G2MR2-5]
MKIKNLAIATLLSTAIMSLPTVYAKADDDGENVREFPGKMHRMEGRHHGFKRMLAHVGLTDEQKSQIHQLKESNKEAVEARHEKIHELKMQIHQLLKGDEIDRQAVKNLSYQVADLKVEQAIMHAGLKKQVLAMLTDEQKSKMEEMKKKRIERMKAHMDI